MVIDKSSNRLKLCFDIRLIGGCSMQISPFQIDYTIGQSQNSVLYICNTSYTFEKRYYDFKYSPYRLIIPPYLDREKDKLTQVYAFRDNGERYMYLKKFKYDLIEYTKSGAFGNNPNARVLTYQQFWFVY